MDLIKKLRWQFLVILLALIVIAAILWGQQAEPVVVESPEPTGGGVYKEGLVGSLRRLNPLLARYNPVDQDVTSLLFTGLVQYDSKGYPQPDLANSWGISRNGEVYNFSLRTDAVWHDGQPVTSEDVVFTVNLLKEEEFPTPRDVELFWKDIEVEALDEKTLQFRLPEPFAPFLSYLNFGVLPSHVLEDISPDEIVDAEFNLNPIGTGPYQFDRFLGEGDQISGVVLKKFEDYYQDQAFLDEFVFIYFDSYQEAWEAYENGEILGIGRIPEGILTPAMNAPDFNLYTSRLPEISLVLLNLDNPEVPFFQEVDLRRAMLKGLNRQWMVDHVLAGQAVIADGPIFPKTWAYYEGVTHYNYEPEEALETLRDLGYTIPAEGGEVRVNEEEVRLEFTLLYPDDPRHEALAEAIQEDWSTLGFDVNLEAHPYQELREEYLANRVYEAALIDFNLSHNPDPDPYPFWHQTQTTGGQNYSMWDDRQASEYIEQARIIFDNPDERARLYRNFQVRFVDQMPALPLFYPMYTYGVSEDVKGVRIGPVFKPSDRLKTVTDWYIFSEVPGGQSPSGTPLE